MPTIFKNIYQLLVKSYILNTCIYLSGKAFGNAFGNATKITVNE